ncbi:hypothetical protein DPMN_048826 [Dreissena polymorpha]|uniref:Uncharacterized protein n=1 Tax=Dreissena polymorpha TaxID=45954 RepID=A0A9D4DC93_DREPO|nr:hypothetical protein DPMN_048826 [Dreissena polymorpha]
MPHQRFNETSPLHPATAIKVKWLKNAVSSAFLANTNSRTTGAPSFIANLTLLYQGSWFRHQLCHLSHRHSPGQPYGRKLVCPKIKSHEI